MPGKFRQLILPVVLMLALFGLTPTSGTLARTDAYLRIVHASPDAPTVEAYLDGQQVVSALKFTTASPYVSVSAGSHRLQAMAAGSGPGGKGLIDTTIDLQSGQAYTVVAADTQVKMTSIVVSDITATVPDNKSAVRLFHASPDAPSVADIALAGGGAVVFKNVAFKAGTDYLEVAPGSYAFEVRPSGTTQAIATTPSLTLAGGEAYSVFAMGLLGNNSFQAIVFSDRAATGGVGAPPTTGGGGGYHAAILPQTLLAAALLVVVILPSVRRRRSTSPC